jgi:hypothetical protein
VFALCATNGSDPTAGGSYSIIAMTNVYYAVSGEYLLDNGTDATATASMGVGSGQWGIKAAAFKLSGATPIVPPPAPGTVAPNIGSLNWMMW